MKKTVSTIRDVAAAAGVSTATVSKFINGTQRSHRPWKRRSNSPSSNWATALTRWRSP
ncbi:LacI family DNA-binding transcriptional regulator [Pseudoduganella sp. UC29_106]|uniref:LacI family DNA-binding transcriptional regulator n=1 Tax=Pseudoduganella sp. UC29_106 TaxID=3374553 RepID=UPI0037563D29